MMMMMMMKPAPGRTVVREASELMALYAADRRGLGSRVHKQQPAGSEPVPKPPLGRALSSVLTSYLRRCPYALMWRRRLLPSRASWRHAPVAGQWRVDGGSTGSRREKPSACFLELLEEGLPNYLLLLFFPAWIRHRFELEAFSVGLAMAVDVAENVDGRTCNGGFCRSKGESAEGEPYDIYRQHKQTARRRFCFFSR